MPKTVVCFSLDGFGPSDMDVLGIEIRADSLAVAYLKSSLFGFNFRGFSVFGGESIEARLSGLKSYISGNTIKNPRVAIVMPRDSSVACAIDLPSPGPSAIGGMLRFELEKHLPFRPEDAYWGFDIIAKKEKVFSVLFAAVKKNAVDKIVEKFRGAGLEPERVAFWQASVGNALSLSRHRARGGRIALASLNPGFVALDVFSDSIPVYSRSIKAGLLIDDDPWRAVKAGIEVFLRSGDRSNAEKKIDECVLMTEKAPEVGALAEWERNLGLPVAPLCLNGFEAPSTAAAAYGAAVCAAGKGRINIDLLQSSAVKRPGPGFIRTVALSTVVVISLLLTGATYVLKDWMMLGRLNSAVAEAKARKTKVEGVVDSRNASYGRIKALERIMGRNSGRALDVLKELSVMLPRDTWLTDFEYGEGVVFIEGFSERASSQLLKMERSRFVKDVEFAGPVTKGPDGKEHFRIKIKITDYNRAQKNGEAAK